MIAAYFIGGPEDLTKRVMKDNHPRHMLLMHEIGPLSGPGPEREVECKVTAHKYRCIALERDPAAGRDVAIYVYEGRAE